MTERTCRLGLTPEALDGVGIRRELRRQHLHRHLTAQAGVLGQEDVGHCAGGDACPQRIPAVNDVARSQHTCVSAVSPFREYVVASPAPYLTGDSFDDLAR